MQSQFWYLYPDAEAFAAMHGSPYRYDTFVPILWWAPGVEPAIVHEPVSPAWIAPTLAGVLGIKPPSGCACTGVLPFAVPTRERPPRAGASPDTVGARPAWPFPIPIETRSRAGVMHSFW